MNEEKKIGLDLTEGAIFPKLVRFTLPFLGASLLQTLYSTVDLSVVGLFVGSGGTVGVSMGGKITTMVTMAGMAFANAGQIYIGQLVGAKKREELNDAIGTMVTLLAILAVACSVIVLVLMDWFLQVMNTPEAAYQESYNYIFISAIGFIFIFMYNAVCSVLRGMGDSKNPLIFVAIASVTNLILDVILVCLLGLASGGAALATVISQALSFIIAAIYLYRRKERFGFDFQPKSFRLKKVHVNVIAKLGIPLAGRQLLISGSQLFVTSFVNAFGIVEAAAYGVGEKVYQALNTVDQSFNSAGAGMIAQNIGAKKPERVKGVVRCVLGVGLGIAAVIGIGTICFAEPLFGLFSTDPEVIAYAQSFSYVIAATAVLGAFNGAFMGVLNGAGKGGLSLLGGILDSVVCRIGFCFLFAYALNMGVVGFYMGSNFARIAPVTIGAIYYLSGDWKKKTMIDVHDQENPNGEKPENVA